MIQLTITQNQAAFLGWERDADKPKPCRMTGEFPRILLHFRLTPEQAAGARRTAEAFFIGCDTSSTEMANSILKRLRKAGA
jgi:hypothetical protein